MVPDLCWWGFIKFTVIQKQYAHFRNHISSFAFWSFVGLVICRVMIFMNRAVAVCPQLPVSKMITAGSCSQLVCIQSFHLSCTWAIVDISHEIFNTII